MRVASNCRFLLEELGDRADHIALRLARDLGIDWQRQRLASSPFGLRQIAFFVTEIRKTFLLMQSERVIDRSVDLALRQLLSQLVALRRADDILMIDVMIR